MHAVAARGKSANFTTVQSIMLKERKDKDLPELDVRGAGLLLNKNPPYSHCLVSHGQGCAKLRVGGGGFEEAAKLQM